MASRTRRLRAPLPMRLVRAGGLLEQMQGRGDGPALRLVQGSHIVLRRPWPSDSACLLQQPDGRMVFLLPFAHDHLLVGTTDTDYRGDPALQRAPCGGDVPV